MHENSGYPDGDNRYPLFTEHQQLAADIIEDHDHDLHDDLHEHIIPQQNINRNEDDRRLQHAGADATAKELTKLRSQNLP